MIYCPISVSNGVKQGGCLSLSLFSIYLNNLIINLRNAKFGCKYGSEYKGVFGYADNLSTWYNSHSNIDNFCVSLGKLLDDYGRHPIELIIV